MVRLEHANISVSDVDALIGFLRCAFPAFRVRHEGVGTDGERWVHVGTDDTYVALTEATGRGSARRAPYTPEPGFNHLGYEVDDVEAVRQRLISGGYRESTVPNDHPFRTRIYFYDPEGNDWEFVEYRSADPEDRNDYER